MPTTWNAIFLGQQGVIDSSGGNASAESANVLANRSFGSAGDPLYKHFTTISPDSQQTYNMGGNKGAFSGEADGKVVNGRGHIEYFRDGDGVRHAYDAAEIYHATVTYTDGTTAKITAVLFQDWNGMTYLAPEVSAGADQTALEAKPIQSISVGALTNNVAEIDLTANRQSWNYKTPDASISGTLYDDDDADGARDAGELGLKGVRVELIDASGKVIATTETDANGAYQFANLDVGKYTVRPEKNPDGLNIFEKAGVTSEGISVNLTQGQKATGVDAGFTRQIVDTCENEIDVKDFDSTCNIVSEDVWFMAHDGEICLHLAPVSGFATHQQTTDISSGEENVGVLGNANAGTARYTIDNPLPYDIEITLNIAQNEASKQYWDIDFYNNPNKAAGSNLGDQVKIVIKAGQTQSNEFYVGTSDLTKASWSPVADIKVTSIKALDNHGNYDPVTLDVDCSVPGRIWASSPIAFDLSGDGKIGVTGESSSQNKTGLELGKTVGFDIDGDGSKDVIEWFDGSGDGILVDNRDGLSLSALAADMDGTRLFGDEGGRFANGYIKLANQFDTNADGVVSGAELNGLQIWRDDGDAVLEAGELFQLSDFGVVSVNTKVNLVTDADGRQLMRSNVETDYEATGQVSYSLEGPDAALFNVDADGKVTFKETPDFENPLDANGDNKYDVTLVRTFANGIDPDCAPEKEALRIEVCDKEEPVVGTASLGDYVWLDTNRNGQQDANERGVAGVVVTLAGAGADGVFGNADDISKTTATDANGKYLFDGLNAGDYRVTFDKPAGYEFTSTDNGAADVDAGDSDANPTTGTTSIVTLSEGEHEPDVDAGLIKKGTASLGDTVWYDTNKNGRQDAGEAGAANVTVTLTGAGVDGVIGTADDLTQTTTTDANGKYLFDELDAGDYKVTFGKPEGYEFTSTDGGGAGTDAGDSDADPITGMTPTVTLSEGEHEPDVDAGLIRKGTASLGDTVWFDTNRNGRQDAGEAGAANVTVTLTGAGADGVIGTADDLTQTATTDANGKYLFDELDAGDYKVTFGKPAGYDFTTTDGGAADTDAGDSDADRVTGMTSVVSLSEGENELDVDAGLVRQSAVPAAGDDAGTVCATEDKDINVLANDSDVEGPLGITSVNGQAIAAGGSVTLASGAVVTLNADGTLNYSSVTGSYQVNGQTITAADLLIGQKAGDSFTYTVTDTDGQTAMATVDMSICGSKNTLDTIAASLPEGGIVEISLDDSFGGAFYTATLSETGDERFDGKSFDIAYCVAARQNIDLGVEVPYKFYLASEGEVPTGVIAHPENLDMVNWLLNQDFDNLDNGDGTGTTYTQAEIQGAIWGLTDDIVFVEEELQNYGTTENAQEIYEMALANGRGFEAGEGDIVGLILDPVEGPDADQPIQPFIIGIQWDDIAQDCLCG